MCLRDQVVVHLAPIDPLLLQPGDFYLQVAPFCDQSARIVVCSLLEEEGLRVEVVEETPIPETSYPCIFSPDWLEEINQGRHGTHLSQCLLTTEQGVVRLPWEQVAIPEFVDVPQVVWSSMASAPPSYSLLSPPLPLPPPLPDFSAAAAQSSPSNPPLLPKESSSKKPPVTVQNSDSKSSSHPSAFSVQTRICPAKHGIAVSLCLVDTSTTCSSNTTEPEPKPIGWVSPNTWDSRCTVTGTDRPTDKSVCVGSVTTASIGGDTNASAGADKSEGVFENLTSGQGKHKDIRLQDTSTSGPVDQVCSISVAEGEYIDILQAAMLFGGAQALTQEKHLQVEMQPHSQIQAEMQRYKHMQAQMQPHAQMQEQSETYMQTPGQASTQITPQTQPYMHVQSPTKPQTHNNPRSRVVTSFRPNVPGETGPPSTLINSQPHHPHSDSYGPSLCVRTVRFSEKPCTPCMKRKQGGKVSRAQELRCRYRESYQAAIQNPVTFEQERERGKMLAVVEEDISQCDERQRPPLPERGNPWWRAQGTSCDPATENQSTSPVSGDVCKESGEKNTVPYWKPGEINNALFMDYRDKNAFNCCGQPEQTTEKNTMPFRKPADGHAAKHKLHSVNGTTLEAGTRINATKSCGVSSSLTDSKQADVTSAKPFRLQFCSSEISGMNMSVIQPHEGLQNRNDSTGMSRNISKSLHVPQSRRESVLSDGRSSSLSTAVVDTSEKCEVVIVQGQNVRRRERTESCAEMVPQLHVVKCKNATAFGLVSPKINRRKIISKGIKLLSQLILVAVFVTCFVLK